MVDKFSDTIMLGIKSGIANILISALVLGDSA